MPTLFIKNAIGLNKIPQRNGYQGSASWAFNYDFEVIVKINNIVLKRYGNPDMPNLGTLKNQFQIYRLFRVKIYNM